MLGLFGLDNTVAVVRQVVPTKVAVAPELFSAIVVLAHVWLLVGVGPHVGL